MSIKRRRTGIAPARGLRSKVPAFFFRQALPRVGPTAHQGGRVRSLSTPTPPRLFYSIPRRLPGNHVLVLPHPDFLLLAHAVQHELCPSLIPTLA